MAISQQLYILNFETIFSIKIISENIYMRYADFNARKSIALFKCFKTIQEEKFKINSNR